MIKRIDGINLYTQDAKKLADFYIDKVGVKMTMEGEMGENEQFFGFEFGKEANFFIMTHSMVKEKNMSPERYLINFEVDDIDKEIGKLKRNGVKIIKEMYHLENYGYIATFEDIDGNYFQLVQVQEN
jgi:predicted enzyme related to lactoylglutathione lyase